jgi:hypothetical protein
MSSVRLSRLRQSAAVVLTTWLVLGLFAPHARGDGSASLALERKLSGINQRTKSVQHSLDGRASQITDKQAELSQGIAQCGAGSIGRRAHCMALLQPKITELSELSKQQAAEKVELMRLRENKKAVGKRLEALMAAEAAAEKARSVASQASSFSDPADQADAKVLQPSAEKEKERPLVSSLAVK